MLKRTLEHHGMHHKLPSSYVTAPHCLDARLPAKGSTTLALCLRLAFGALTAHMLLLSSPAELSGDFTLLAS